MILTIENVKQDYTRASSLSILSERIPDIQLTSTPQDCITMFVKIGMYGQALSLAKSENLSMEYIYESMAK